MSESLSGKSLLKRVEPKFPDDARAAGVEGDVVFRIVLGTNGMIKEIHLLRGKALLIEVAAKAVSEWQYRPFHFERKTVEVETYATVRFH
jgi:protein TonB